MAHVVKKLFIGILVIVLAIVLLAPLAMGFLAKQELERTLVELNHSKAFRVDQLDYQRGWLQSSAKYQVTALSDPERSLILTSKANHGPVLFENGISLGLLSTEVSFSLQDLLRMLSLSSTLRSDAIWHYTGSVSLFGKRQLSLIVPETEINILSGPAQSRAQKVLLRDLALQIHLFPSESRLEYQGQIAELDQVFNNKTVRVLDSHFNGEFEFQEPKNFSASGTLGVNRMIELSSVTQFDDGQMLMDTMVSNFFIRSDGEDTVEVRLDSDVVDFVQANGVPADIKLAARAEHLDLKAFYKLYSLRFAANPPPFLKTEQSYCQQESTQSVCRESLIDLLKKSPTIELKNLSFYSADEKATFKSSMAFNYSLKLSLADIDKPKILKRYLVVDGYAEATDGLAKEMAAEWLTSKMAQSRMGENLSLETIRTMSKGQAGTFLVLQDQLGNIKRSDRGYFANFKMSEGKTWLNGNPFPQPPVNRK